eukprot:NODE_152_length_16986_cov_0.478119.p2 type:complete len:748 gc:universal NODE_152_length_16986_cov_0.478119:10117-7874(-)
MEFISQFDEGNLEYAISMMEKTDFIGHNFTLDYEIEVGDAAAKLLGTQTEKLSVIHYALLNLDTHEAQEINENRREILKLLIERVSKDLLQARSDNGNTPVHVAAFLGELEILELMLRKGAAINAENHMGLRAVDLASNADTLSILKKYQKSPHKRGKSISSRDSTATSKQSTKNFKMDSKASLASIKSDEEQKTIKPEVYKRYVRKSSQEKMLEAGSVRNNPFLKKDPSTLSIVGYSKSFQRLQIEVDNKISEMIDLAVKTEPSSGFVVEMSNNPNSVTGTPLTKYKEPASRFELSNGIKSNLKSTEHLSSKDQIHEQEAFEKTPELPKIKSATISASKKQELVPKLKEGISANVRQNVAKEDKGVLSMIAKINNSKNEYIPKPFVMMKKEVPLATHHNSPGTNEPIYRNDAGKNSTLEQVLDVVDMKSVEEESIKIVEIVNSIRSNKIDSKGTSKFSPQESNTEEKSPEVHSKSDQRTTSESTDTVETNSVKESDGYFDISHINFKKKSRGAITSVFKDAFYPTEKKDTERKDTVDTKSSDRSIFESVESKDAQTVIEKLRSITENNEKVPILMPIEDLTLSVPKMEWSLESDLNKTFNSLKSFSMAVPKEADYIQPLEKGGSISSTANKSEKSLYGSEVSISEAVSRPFSRQSMASCGTRNESYSDKYSERYSNISSNVFVSPGQMIGSPEVEAIQGTSNVPVINNNKIFFVYVTEIQGLQPNMIPAMKGNFDLFRTNLCSMSG